MVSAGYVYHSPANNRLAERPFRHPFALDSTGVIVGQPVRTELTVILKVGWVRRCCIGESERYGQLGCHKSPATGMDRLKE